MTTETQGYWSTITQLGEEEYNLAQLENRAVPYTYIVFGDGGGEYVAPDKTRTALVREVHRAPITAAYTKPENPNWLYLETVVPATEGGWWVREIGAVTSTDKLVVIGSYAPAYKPKLGESEGLIGVRADLKVTLVVETTSSAPAELVVDPSAVFATLASIAMGIQQHNADPDAHTQASTEVYGFARLATPAQSLRPGEDGPPLSDRLAVTPVGLHAALQQHAQDRDGHPKATVDLFGFTRLATVEEAKLVDAPRNDIAVTPAGLQAVVNALVSAMPDDSMPAHLQAADPHSQYFNAARLGAAFATLMGEHLAEADPHTQYFNEARLSALLVNRDKAARARRHYFANL